jgi:hypothetical protein
MRTRNKLTFLDKCRVKWGVSQGWHPARIAITLGIPLESVYAVLDDGFSGPEAPIAG